MTGVVAVVVTGVKAPGSLLVLVLIPCLVRLMLLIVRQYQQHAASSWRSSPSVVFRQPQRHERVVIPVPNLSRAVVQAVQVGRALSDDVQMVHVTDDREEGERLRVQFERQFPGVPFVIVESPYRALVRPFVTYLDVTDPRRGRDDHGHHPRVRGTPLVGADALQPDRQPAARGAAGSPRHGGGDRALPAGAHPPRTRSRRPIGRIQGRGRLARARRPTRNRSRARATAQTARAVTPDGPNPVAGYPAR